MKKAFTAILAALSLVASTSVAASVAPPVAAAASVHSAAAVQPGDEDDDDDTMMWILIAIGAGLLIWGLIAVLDDGNEDELPVSP